MLVHPLLEHANEEPLVQHCQGHAIKRMTADHPIHGLQQMIVDTTPAPRMHVDAT
jgi:hypothetical protein